MPEQGGRPRAHKPDRHLLHPCSERDHHRQQQLPRDHRGWRCGMDRERSGQRRRLHLGGSLVACISIGSEVDPMNAFPIAPLPAEAWRFGPLAPLLDDPQVTEIMVMGASDIYVEVAGKIMLTPISFANEDELMHVIRYIVESVGRHVDVESPLCDARLADGSRVHVAIPPVAVDGPLLNIRRFMRGPLNMADLVRLGSCSESAFGFLKACVMTRANILVS